MKQNILAFILVLTLILIFASCKEDSIKNISESQLIELIKSNKVSNIKIENNDYAKVYLINNNEHPSFKVDIKSNYSFYSKIIKLGHEYSFDVSKQTFPVYKSYFLIITLVYTLGLVLYFLGGIICLYIILKNEFKNPTDKIAWVISIIFAPVVGVILFLIIGRKQIIFS